jgi:hypothetical protein
VPEGFDWVTRVDDWQHDHESLNLALETAADHRAGLRFQALSPFIWRITFRPRGTQLMATPMVVGNPPPAPALHVAERQSGLTVFGTDLSLEIDCDP